MKIESSRGIRVGKEKSLAPFCFTSLGEKAVNLQKNLCFEESISLNM